MSKKALITTISVALVVIAMLGLSVGISFAVGAWRVDDIKTGVETEMDSWNAAVKDMVFEPITDESGAVTAYKLVYYRGTMNAITVPSTYGENNLPVTTIGSKFTRLNGIALITLPSSVTTIEDNALMGFKHLKHIDFAPTGLTTIGKNVLNGCNQLSWIWLPPTLTTLGEGALSQCGRLKHIDFAGDKSALTVGKNALTVNAIANGGCTIAYNVTEVKSYE